MGKLMLCIAILTALIMPALALNQTSQISNLIYLTEQYPPFSFQENGKLKGISIDLMDKMLNKMDSNLSGSDIELLPWSQGYQTTLKERNAVFFPIARLPEWNSLFKWVGPISPIQTVIFAMQERQVRINDLKDLNKYKIGVVRGSAEQLLLTKIGVNAKNLVQEEDVDTIIKMLKSGSIDIDAWAYAEQPGIWLINRSGIIPNDYDLVYDVGDQVELFYAFNKEAPDSLVWAFQNALNQTKQYKGVEGTSDYDKILYKYLPVRYIIQNVTNEQVVQLANRASSDIENDAPGTLKKISAEEPPYKDKVNPELYVYVYDTNVTFVAHADNPMLNGFNFKGKADVTGKKFADETVAGAIKNGTGWMDYVWTNPAKSGLYYKTAYYKLTRGSNGNQYIVCAGKYKARQKS
jgi:polar amino acid transport system substrate-binding protein